MAFNISITFRVNANCIFNIKLHYRLTVTIQEAQLKHARVCTEKTIINCRLLLLLDTLGTAFRVTVKRIHTEPIQS
jgi:hypothetical protein